MAPRTRGGWIAFVLSNALSIIMLWLFATFSPDEFIRGAATVSLFVVVVSVAVDLCVNL